MTFLIKRDSETDREHGDQENEQAKRLGIAHIGVVVQWGDVFHVQLVFYDIPIKANEDVPRVKLDTIKLYHCGSSPSGEPFFDHI